MKQTSSVQITRLAGDALNAKQLVTLVLGFDQGDLRRLPSTVIPENTSVHFTQFSAITSEVLHDLQPVLIISPLVFQGFDACEVAARLSRFGFNGRYRVVTNTLPHPAMVKGEISNVAPTVTVELVDQCSA